MIEARQLGAGDDLAAASQLLKLFFRQEGFNTPAYVIDRNVRRMAEIETCGLFIAEVKGSAIGVATVSMEFGIEFGWFAELGDLYVLPDWRGRGVSRLLVTAAEAFLVSRGATGYQVTVTPFASEHHGLEHYYAKLGFSDEGRMIFVKALR